MSFSNLTRRTMKWYKKLFFRLMDLAVYNAYILYKYLYQDNLQLSNFRLELIKEVCSKYANKPTSSCSRTINFSKRLVGRHFISSIGGKNKQRRCHVCSHTNRHPRKQTKTRFECMECNVGLCIEPCFQIFHTNNFF